MQDTARQRYSRQRLHFVLHLGRFFWSNQQEGKLTSALHSPDTRGAGLLRAILVNDVSAPFGRGAIRAWCQAHGIVEVISRFVPLDQRGVGSCPFDEHHHRGDVHPSFQVFGTDNPHWYCYTWGRAGDVFNFL